MTPGTALRELQRAQSQMRKARQALRDTRAAAASPESRQAAFRVGWNSLTLTHRTLAAIPAAAVNEEVLTRQLSVQRYATALLVRLRRLYRNDPAAGDDLDLDESFEE